MESEKSEEHFSSSISTGINFDKYKEIPVAVDGRDPPDKVSSFDLAGLDPLIVQNVSRAGYKTLTPVQQHAVPIILAGRDLVGVAQTGSGKTAAFLLPILQMISGKMVTTDGHTHIPYCLVVTPTRELALQIHAEATRFSYQSELRCALAYGGMSAEAQLSAMSRGCHILVATPGRLLDYINQGLVSLRQVHYLVLDEADRMLDMGFMPDIQRIVNNPEMMPKGKRKTMMFSATFPPTIQRVAAEFLDDYLFLAVGLVGGACTDVAQEFFYVEQKERINKLAELISANPSEKTLVFLRTKRKTQTMAKKMEKKGFSCTCIHGNKSQAQREAALLDFRSGRSPVLLATAVVSRGLDIPGVGHVVNFDLPLDVEEYVHRIGRTGRAGNIGRATSFYERKADLEIAADMVKMLDQCHQSVPDWLRAEAKIPATKKNKKDSGGPVAFPSKAKPSQQVNKPTKNTNPGVAGGKNCVMVVNELASQLDWDFVSECGGARQGKTNHFTWRMALGEFKAEGEGNSKKEAKAMAAAKLLETLPDDVYGAGKQKRGAEGKNEACVKQDVTGAEAERATGQSGSSNSSNGSGTAASSGVTVNIATISSNGETSNNVSTAGTNSSIFTSVEKIKASVLQPAVKNSTMAIHELSARTGMTLEWVSVGESGPPHSKIFTWKVILGGSYSATGEGANKKIARSSAADELLKMLPPDVDKKQKKQQADKRKNNFAKFSKNKKAKIDIA